MLRSLIFSVPEFIDPVFAKTSPKRSFSMTEKETDVFIGLHGSYGEYFFSFPFLDCRVFSLKFVSSRKMLFCIGIVLCIDWLLSVSEISSLIDF
jgi:hypothetical protein